MRRALQFLVAAAVGARVDGALLGVDVSQPVDAAAAACMKSQHAVSFAVVRAWHSTGSFDPNAPSSLRAFTSAGINTSVYLFPCVGKSAGEQLSQLQGNLTKAGAPRFTSMFFDIESNPDPACAWSATDFAANCAYMASLVEAAEGNPFFAGRTGVYASAHEWGLIMGSADACANAASTLPLWYPHYETPANPSFSDFAPFGGWTQPTIKQYADGPATCGVGTDLNWRP